MRQSIEDRVKEVAKHIIKYDLTIRETANLFGCSKSTIHMDAIIRLPLLDKVLYEQVRAVLDHHIEIRNIKGGEATRVKFLRRVEN
jgi:putative DeoR family transcriptional regulator (stage III sporulation protein D)